MRAARGIHRWWRAVGLLAAAGCAIPRGEPRECVVTGSGGSADFALARRSCARAESRFTELTGRDPPPGGIVLSRDGGMVAEAGSQGWRLQWPISSRMRETARTVKLSDDDVRKEWESTLPHELGHLLLAADLYRHGIPVPSTGYGTALPDWLDEAIAVWMEPDAERAERLRQARLLTHDTLGMLAEVLRAEHPLSAMADDGPYATRIVVNGPCRRCPERPHPERVQRIVYRYFRDGRAAAETTYVRDSANVALDEPEARFYAHSYALLAWIRQRGGRTAVAALLARARNGLSDERLITGLPGLPDEPSNVAISWWAWLKANR